MYFFLGQRVKINSALKRHRFYGWYAGNGDVQERIQGYVYVEVNRYYSYGGVKKYGMNPDPNYEIHYKKSPKFWRVSMSDLISDEKKPLIVIQHELDVDYRVMSKKKGAGVQVGDMWVKAVVRRKKHGK